MNRHLRHPFHEVRLTHLGMVDADRVRCEEREEIQETAACTAVVDIRALTSLQVEDEVESIDQHVLFERTAYIGGLHRQHRWLLLFVGICRTRIEPVKISVALGQ